MKILEKSPILTSFVFVFFIIGLHQVPMYRFFESLNFSKNEADLMDKILLNLIIIIITYFFLRKINLLSESGLYLFKMNRPYLYLILILYVLIFTSGFRSLLKLSNEELYSKIVLLFLVKSLTVGVLEEIVFRGLILNLILRKFLLKNKSVLLSVTISSIIFGVAHLININEGHYTLTGVFSQIFAASCLGSLFCTILLKTSNIYPIMILHSAISFGSLLGTLFPSKFVERSTYIESNIQSIISIFFTIIIFGSAYLISIIIIRKFPHSSPLLSEQN